MGTLSVRENLAFSAALRLPMSVSRQQRAEKVKSVINELGLSHVANTKVRMYFTYNYSIVVCICKYRSVICDTCIAIQELVLYCYTEHVCIAILNFIVLLLMFQ